MRTSLIPPSQIYNDAIYSGKYDFNIQHTKGDLAQCFIKATISTGLTAVVIKNDLGSRLLSSIRLHNGSSTIAYTNPYHFTARLDMADDTLYSKISTGIRPQANAFSTGTGVVVLYIPLWFWFSESLDLALELLNRKQLFIEITTSEDRNAMGMSVD